MTPTRKSPRVTKGIAPTALSSSRLRTAVKIEEGSTEEDEEPVVKVEEDEEPVVTVEEGEGLPAKMQEVHHKREGSSICAGKEEMLLCTHQLNEEFKDHCDLLSRVFRPLEHGNGSSGGTQLVNNKALLTSNVELARAKQTGQLVGSNVGDVFKNRVDLHESLVHRGHQHGIFGDEGVGAYSVVLSNGYDDNEDQGTSFLFTGEGGLVRPKKGKQPTSRTGCPLSLPSLTIMVLMNPLNSP